jgi:protein-S-isoprenylcysteine O-methyltransferase Ste14
MMVDKRPPGEKGADVRFPPPLVFVGAVIVGVIVDRFIAPISFPLTSTIAISSGLVLMAAAMALAFAARAHFKRTGQNVKPWEPTPELIFEGPYRYTRNPMYVALTLLQISIGLLLNNVWVSLLAVLALIIVHFIAVLPEETYLSGKFGESYRAYLTRVRRYL